MSPSLFAADLEGWPAFSADPPGDDQPPAMAWVSCDLEPPGLLTGPLDSVTGRTIGRYRLETLERRVTGAAIWRASDDSLNRHVMVWELHAPVPAERLLAAIRGTIRAADPRLCQIYDADIGSQDPHIVTEWTPGWNLDQLLFTALPTRHVALAITIAVAEVLTIAHAAGQPHLRLRPDVVCWNASRGIKVSGLGIEAALAGDSPDDPGATDTRALAALLYALLTGRWAGDEPTALPPAPRHHGIPRLPGDVRHGIPGVLDSIVERALLPAGDLAITCPAQFAWELQAAMRTLTR